MRERLIEIDLCGTSGFDDVGLKALAAYCTRLATLRISECDVSAGGLAVVAEHCRSLRVVQVSERLATTSEGWWIGRLPRGCQVEAE
jgi:hypothetical protein